MGYIFCLMGKSSSGKDSIYRELFLDSSLNIKKIIPGTTRPIREGEKNGEEYFFHTEEEFVSLKERGLIIESRSYNTIHGVWHYFTAQDEALDIESNNYLAINTLEAYISLCKYFGEEKVIPIYVTVDDGERLMRALKREMQQESPKYKELCRRFLADEEDFSEEKLIAAGVKKYFENKELNATVKEVSDYIKGFI